MTKIKKVLSVVIEQSLVFIDRQPETSFRRPRALLRPDLLLAARRIVTDRGPAFVGRLPRRDRRRRRRPEADQPDCETPARERGGHRPVHLRRVLEERGQSIRHPDWRLPV